MKLITIPGRRYVKVAREDYPGGPQNVVAFIDMEPGTWQGAWYEPKSWTQRGRLMAAAYWKSLAAELTDQGILPEGALR